MNKQCIFLFIIILSTIFVGCSSSYNDCYNDCQKIYFDKKIYLKECDGRTIYEVFNNTPYYPINRTNWTEINEICFNECKP